MVLDLVQAASVCSTSWRIDSVCHKGWQPGGSLHQQAKLQKTSCNCGSMLVNNLLLLQAPISRLVVSQDCLLRWTGFSSSSNSIINRRLRIISSSSSHLQQFGIIKDDRKCNHRLRHPPTAIRDEHGLPDYVHSFENGGTNSREISQEKITARATTGASLAETVTTTEVQTLFVPPPPPRTAPSSAAAAPHQFPLEKSKEVDFTPPASQTPVAKPSQSRKSQPYVESASEKEAWALLKEAVVTYCGEPVGTIAARDPSDPFPTNYDQVFIRDFIPSAIGFLLKGEYEIVRNFLIHTLQLQSWEKTVDCYSPGQGLMPASFKVLTVFRDGDEANGTEEILDPDFGEAAIGRVAPVDSGLWWIILLRAYAKCTGDTSLQERIDFQTGIKMILKVCLADGFDMFPTLLVTDGPCMIDRRMGIHGHPLEIQALFYQALRFSRDMLVQEDGVAQELKRSINSRLSALLFHIQEYYWLDIHKLNEIYRYKTEEYSDDAVNKFNIYPEQVSKWLFEWIPNKGGYFIGNLQPAQMDFRFFSLGNFWSICSSLATKSQAEDILDLVESKWDDLIGTMPLKICFPAFAEDEWRIITGSDPKNTAWSYHNGGSWPTLMWQFSVACLKMGRPDLAQRAVEIAEKRLSRDRWPEYYDTPSGRFVGKQARLFQTWTIAGFLVTKLLLRNPEAASWLTCDEEEAPVDSCHVDMHPRWKKFSPSSNSNIV
ncbi:unnamed protein product [Sphagnum troendelagicum]|uniref:Alkaline/neutral invertase n=1 Tax=Sphagnum troendelagicum TaxID=128251 RepID=A0ABP0UM20_9BRYO